MKSERRHELEQNLLAQWLTKAVATTKPYANAILAAILAVVLVWLVISYLGQRSEAQSTKAWDDYFAALSEQSATVPDLEKVAKEHQGTVAGTWALLTAADLQLNSGCSLLFTNKASANLELRHALDNYLRLQEQSGADEVRRRAILGEARAREALGDLDRAQERYEHLLKQWPKGVDAAVARKRLADIQNQSTKEFYDQFAKYDPKPAAAQGPGTPGQRPDFNLESLPDGAPAAKPGSLLDQQPKPDVKLPRLNLKTAPAENTDNKSSEPASSSAKTDAASAAKLDLKPSQGAAANPNDEKK